MPAAHPITPLSPTALRQFILAGRTTFTAKNTARGSHYSFEVRFDGSWPARVHVLGVGQERHILGYINWRGSFYKVGRSEYAKTSPQHICFAWLWQRVQSCRSLPSFVEVWHHGQCCRCGRELTDPTSIARGYGPECWHVVANGATLAARLAGVASALLDGEAVALPAVLAGVPPVVVGNLLRLLALDDVASWSQARELAVAACLPVAVVDHLDALIAARLGVLCGGKAKKGLAAAVKGAGEVDGWWWQMPVGELGAAA